MLENEEFVITKVGKLTAERAAPRSAILPLNVFPSKDAVTSLCGSALDEAESPPPLPCGTVKSVKPQYICPRTQTSTPSVQGIAGSERMGRMGGLWAVPVSE